MSVSFGKNGIVTTSGIEIGANLARNSSLSNDLTLWDKSGTWDFVEKNGFSCLHHSGALSTSANVSIPSTIENTSSNSFTPYNGLTLTLSCDVLFNNVVKGTTNYYVTLYKSGQTLNGSWRTPTIINKSDHFTLDYLDPSKMNGKGWQRVWVTIQFGDYQWNSGYKFSLYARDYTGDTYWKNFKLEYESCATPWIPNVNDYGVVPTSHGFAEQNTFMSVYEEYITTPEFIEY